MKKAVILLSILAIVFSLHQYRVYKLQKNLEEYEIESGRYQADFWIVDKLDLALTKAQTTGKPLLITFR